MKLLTWGNPYTHEEHQRITYGRQDLPKNSNVCEWCGQERQRLYSYDGHKGIFCNKVCYHSYYF